MNAANVVRFVLVALLLSFAVSAFDTLRDTAQRVQQTTAKRITV
jgi:hypothetical protein